MMKMDIKSDIADAKEGLEALGLEIKNINRKILRTLTTRAKTKVRTSYRQNLNTKSGVMIGSAYSSAKNNVAGWVGLGSPLAMVQETGKTINAKGKYMRIFIGKTIKTAWGKGYGDGKWLTVKSVSIPARPFFYPAMEEFAGSAEYMAIIEKVLAREIKRAWEKQ
jgi:hypothetical protein